MAGGDPQLPDGVRLGEVFAGRYRLDAIIGSGAMGVVVSGHDRRLDVPVAIKFLTAPTLERHDGIRRLVGEAQSLARLRSEHVVLVKDVALHEDRVPYIVMERLIGSDLATELRTSGPFRVEDAVDYMLEACEGISEAHRHGIVHRDLKPANLFLVRREQARSVLKVLDFGVAKRAPAGETDWNQSLVQSETGEKAILGSPSYMSPEQMDGSGEVDHRADIWALGITLYELLIGEPPYRGVTLIQLHTRMTTPGAQPWRARLDECEPGLVAIVGKCLQADRTRRYASVADLASDLAPFGSKSSRDSAARIRRATNVTVGAVEATIDVVSPRSGLPSSQQSPAPQTADVRVARRTMHWSPRVSLVLVAAAGVIGAMVFWRPSPPGERAHGEHREGSLVAPSGGSASAAATHEAPRPTPSANATSAEISPPSAVPASVRPAPAVAQRPPAVAARSSAHGIVDAAPLEREAGITGPTVVPPPTINLADASFNDLPPDIVRTRN